MIVSGFFDRACYRPGFFGGVGRVRCKRDGQRRRGERPVCCIAGVEDREDGAVKPPMCILDVVLRCLAVSVVADVEIRTFRFR